MREATERTLGLMRLIAKTRMRRSVVASVSRNLDSDFTEHPRLFLVPGPEFVSEIA